MVSRFANNCTSHRGLSKWLYLLVYGAGGAFIPLMSIYLKFLGMRADQIGPIIGMRPLVTSVVAPVWGWLADKFRCRRSVVLTSIFFWMIFVTFLLLCPLLGDVYGVLRTKNATAPAHQNGAAPAAASDVSNGVAVTKAPVVKRFHEYKRKKYGKQKEKNGKTDHASGHRAKISDLKAGDSLAKVLNGNDAELLNIFATDGENSTWPPPTAFDHVDNRIVPREERRFVFLILLVGVGVFQVFLAPLFPISDAVALQSLGSETNKWGTLRLFGSLGMGVSATIIGLALTYYEPRVVYAAYGTELKRFIPAFCLAQVFFLFAFIAAAKVRFHITDLRCHEYKVTLVTKMLSSCYYGAYIATALYFSVAMGCTWSFLYWHLHNLGASYTQLGLATLASSLGETVGFLAATRLFTKHGCAAMLVFALSCYSLRFIIYGYVTEPWFAVPTEILHGLSFAFVWAASTGTVCGSTPNKSLASITGIVHGIQSGLGLALGSFLGGLLITQYGAQCTFLYFAMATIFVLLTFVVTHLVVQRPHVQPDFPAEFAVSAPELEKLKDVDDSDDSDDIWAQS